MFLVKKGNTPVMNMCEFPLIVVRYPYNRLSIDRQIHPVEHYDNQVATYMVIDVHSGLAPMVKISPCQRKLIKKNSGQS